MANSNCEYEVLHPWAEVDLIPVRGITPRVTELADKTIGLYSLNRKPASRPILTVVEKQLKERYPSSKISWFIYEKPGMAALSEDKAKFEEWIKGMDTAIAAVGD